MAPAMKNMFRMTYTKEGAAEMADCSRQSIERYIREKKLHCVRTESGRQVIPRASLLKFLGITERDLIVE